MRTIVALLFVLVAAVSAGELLGGENPNAIPGSYIVVMKEGLTNLLRDAHVGDILGSDESNTLLYSYHIGSFVGFAAKLSPESLKAQLAHPDVAYVEVDQIMHATGVQDSAPWGLDRIDQHDLPLNGEFRYNSSAGEGVEVFVIDTGIYTENNDFGGRAEHGFNAITYEKNTDLNGHGTHCAGTIGGTTYGVAKEAKLIAVKVLNEQGSGTNAGVIAGVEYVTGEREKRSNPMVASMSLGGGASSALDAAVANSIASGVVYVVAAGNEDQDACRTSPARIPTAITVGASDANDKRSWFSNWGSCVNITAPGSDIESTWIGGKNAVKVISGTSMACPHVSGVVALHLSHNSAKKTTPEQALDWVVAQGTPNVLSNCDDCGAWPKDTANLLLYAAHKN